MLLAIKMKKEGHNQGMQVALRNSESEKQILSWNLQKEMQLG